MCGHQSPNNKNVIMINQSFFYISLYQRSEFTACSDCTNLGSARQAARNDKERQRIQDIFDSHLLQVE